MGLLQQRREVNADRRDYSISLSTPTNTDAHAVSLAMRAKRRALGEIGEDKITLPATDAGGVEARTFDLALAVGDRVRLFRRTNAVFKASGNPYLCFAVYRKWMPAYAGMTGCA